MNFTKNKISWRTAGGLVLANMIGTGVFTSLGFQLELVQNSWTIVLLWTLGGAMALIGALVYAELGTHFRQTGGDYIFLSQTIHPLVGYLYAWVSLMVGFSAPIAIAAMAMNNYLSPILGESIVPGLFFLVCIPLAHIFSISQSAKFQNGMTILKIGFVLTIIFLGLAIPNSSENGAFNFSSTWKEEMLFPGFAVSLIYVFYAYTGWNSAAYIIEEVDQPSKNLPKALIGATVLVMIFYIAIQLVLLKHATIDQLAGKIQVAEIAFSNLFGPSGGLWVGIFIGVQLIATISGYAWVGPRVTYAMAKDYKLWKPIAHVNAHGVPVRAILVNTFISLLLFLTGSFEQIMLYAGFILQLMSTITVYSSLRIKKETGFKTPFKPIPQLIYLVFSFALMGYLLVDKPKESLIGIGLLILGGIVYSLDKKLSRALD